MATIFESQLLALEKKIRSSSLRFRIMQVLSLGLYRNRDKIDSLKIERLKCLNDYNSYKMLLEDAKRLDADLSKEISINGVRISKAIFADLPVLGREDYPVDWITLRDQILERDGYECQEADGRCNGPLQIHHKVPLSKGGSNMPGNLITLCLYHHILKHPHMQR